VTEARLESIEPDPWLANSFLNRAKQFAADGNREALASESRQVLLHNAAIAACDAILAIEGQRVVGADGGHLLRLDAAHRILPGDHADLFERLDESRASRNQASYAADLVPLADAEETAVAVSQLIELADERVRPNLPDWPTDT